MLLPLEQFQITALKGGESTQQGTLSEHNFYEQVKKANQINRELKQTKKKCVKQSEEWHDTVLEETVIQNSILYKNHCLWISESMIIELLWLAHNEPPNDHQRWDWIKSQIEFYYYWPTLYHDIDCYIFNCMICKCAKVSQQKPVNLLHSLEIF